MNIVFFEVQPWEKESLQKEFPDARLIETPIDKDTASQFADAEIISSFVHSPISKDVIEALPHLKLIAARSTGYDQIDIDTCKAKNILVANVPSYGSNTVAEHAFALILSLTRKIPQAISQAKNHNINHLDLMGEDLKGKTIGIIGLGKIGIEMLRIAKGFGMQVVVYNHSHDDNLAQEYGFSYKELPELLRQSDVVTLHLPLVAETKHIINKNNLSQIKPGCYLINTARGGLIETEAIIEGLEKNIFAGVGLDVLEEESELEEEIILLANSKPAEELKTLLYDHMLLDHPRVLITPHNAFNSREAVERITKTTIENIHAFLSGNPQNIVSNL